MGRKQQYEVRLTEEERVYLEKNSSSGKWTPRQVKRALILLKSDRNQNNCLTDEQIAEEIKCCHSLVNSIREKFVKGDLKSAVQDKPRSGRPKKVDGEVEAYIVSTACSSPPEGRERWTLHLIAERVVRLSCIEDCSHMAVSRVLKKTNLSLG